ncbi:protein of unknown function [Pseudovibrio sp. Tun.PSC04-5.I4]|nr:protein of unknown function [Pseudovibrio sp. Tun.PSC04-5.I4]
MTHEGVWFATTNNSYDCCQRGQNVVGFEALFAPRVNRKTKGYNGPWSVSRGTRRAHLPTCEQAEVLYPKRLSLDHLRAVYVEEDDHHDKAVGLLRDFNYSGVEVFVKPEKFGGQGN